MSAKRVLFVHEDPDCRRIYQVILEHQGYEVITSDDGDDAVRRLSRERFDLVLTDLYVASHGERALVERLRHACDVPLVVMSAWSGDAHQRLAEEAGADAFVAIPVAPQHVARVVERLTTETPVKMGVLPDRMRDFSQAPARVFAGETGGEVVRW